MKNIKVYLLLIIGGVLLNACNDKSVIPALDTPIIISPQNGSVCQGEKNRSGNYTVSIKCMPGSDKFSEYTFHLWNSQGILLETTRSSIPKTDFEVEASKSYVTSVTLSNGISEKQSEKVSFSTPGNRVVNYIPVIKNVTYLKEKKLLCALFYDADSTDEMLFYDILLSKKTDFSTFHIIENNSSIANNTEVQIPLSISKSSYLKLRVRDRHRNTSTYVLYVNL